MTLTLTDKIEICLREAFSPNYLIITDDSHQHIGHAGAANGGKHFSIHISAAVFKEKKLIDSHRLIYQALGDLMEKNIHALQIKIC